MTSAFLPRNAIELLAPARDAETGIIAIDHGADAVYIGGPAFGARAAAGNSLEDIARLCSYAHRYQAKVFVALNTLFKDDEIDAARRLAFDAADAGADVLIVQDMGLLMGPLPEIELHASTQCDIRTPEKAAFLESVGFSQIVLARELSLGEIAAVRAALKYARIEFFVHGALCVSYSGQCYMSQAMTQRSANRGECSQACRLPYDVETLDGRRIANRSHVLSLHDNDQSEHLEALIDAGASSFKIEGRLKDAAYVKNVTAFYRRKLDAILARRPDLTRASQGKEVFSFAPSPERVFNRGRTDYFIEGKRFDADYRLAALASPKNTGTPVGRVEQIGKDVVIAALKPGVTIANGDGLTYAADDEICGLAVNRAEATGRKTKTGEALWALYPAERIAKLNGLAVGAALSRNRDHAFLKTLAGKTAERRIPVTMTLEAGEHSLVLSMTDGVSTGTAAVELELQRAADVDKSLANLRQNLLKLGDTPFACSDEHIRFCEPFDRFVPASFANRLRRAAAEDLLAKREAARPKPQRGPVDESAPYPQKTLDYAANVGNRLAKAFYAAHGARVLSPAFEIVPVKNAALMTCRHCIRASLKRCPKMLRYHPEWLEADPDRSRFRPEPLVLINSAGQRFVAEFRCKANPCEMVIRSA